MRASRPTAAFGAVLAAAVALGAGPGTAAAGTTAAGTDARGPGARALTRALCEAESGTEAGTLGEPGLSETSGLAWSRDRPGIRWAHNDSGDTARIFALRRDGSSRGTIAVRGAAPVDWEDIAIGRGPGGRDHLFLGDIGGGAEEGREVVTVHRVPEPRPPGAGRVAASAPADPITLTYPDGPHDAEALLVDERTGDLVIVTKGADSSAAVYRARGAADARAGTTAALERVGDLARPPIGTATRALLDLTGLGDIADQVTGADASVAGVAVIRTYGGVAVHPWPERVALADALSMEATGEPCSAPAPTDLRYPQGEAIALAADGRRYVTVSEGIGAPLVEVRSGR